MFYRDLDTFWKKVKFQNKIQFLLHARKIYLHWIALDSQNYINSVFYQDFDTFWKKLKFKKISFFVARVQNLPAPDSPRFPKIHKICVL